MKKIYFNSLESSNDYLKEQYNNLCDEDVIIAINQTKGRGRLNRTWISNDDLTFSILFKNPNINHHLIAPIAILLALKNYNIISKIKWPNDIYVENKKICGILEETVYFDNKYMCNIVGFGINFTEKLNIESTFLNKYLIYDKDAFLNMVLDKYKILLTVSTDKLLKIYKDNNLVLGKNIEYRNRLYKISGFTINGEIIIISENNKVVLSPNEIDIKESIIKYLQKKS